MDLADVIVFGFFGALALWALVALHRVRAQARQRRREFEAAGGFLAVAKSETFTDEAGTFTIDGIMRGGKNSRPGAIVSVSCCEQGDFDITFTNRWDALFFSTGLSWRLTSGDDTFDSRFVVATDAPDAARVFFSSPEVRQAVHAVFDKGFREISCAESVLKATIWPFLPATPAESKVLHAVVPQLRVLAGALEGPFGATAVTGRRRPWARLRGWANSVAALFVLLSIALFFQAATREGQLLDNGLFYLFCTGASLALFLILVVLTCRLCRKVPSAHRLLGAFWGLCGIGLLISGIGGALILNFTLDDAPAVEHVARIVKVVTVYRGRSRLGRSNVPGYQAVFRSWRPGRETERISIHGADYLAIETSHDRTIVVQSKPGWLGFEWIASYQFRP